ncbi:MAG: hypothetical protein ACXV5G_12205, partial [Halobacteriota archaeon]
GRRAVSRPYLRSQKSSAVRPNGGLHPPTQRRSIAAITVKAASGATVNPERNPQGLKPDNLSQSNAGMNACSTP